MLRCAADSQFISGGDCYHQAYRQSCVCGEKRMDLGTTVMLGVLVAVIAFGLWGANNIARSEGRNKEDHQT
ncbi:hypothetical protein G6F50_018695 [Rhizopus delemar]|uniref:Uncharacterized protein n=1 Tax=Rhizopus delemar TaxID=936053 RepID=A0A9P7BY98_9FUNG|nr:hypothetical protein G6F50_018695 [Rhizopus delemar]